jgi:hypothetical protein
MRTMIYILPRGKALPVTPKGNVKRKEAEQVYASEIASLYTKDTTFSISSPSSKEPLPDFLRDLFARVSGVPITNVHNWTSLFNLGIDSQLALAIRHDLSKRLGKSITLSTIFENPSICQLAGVLEPTLVCSKSKNTPMTFDQIIKKMISKLEFEFQIWAPRVFNSADPPISNETETVLLTGSTGSMGTALLEALSYSSRVTKIYALVRGPNHSNRLKQSLERRGIDPSILDKGNIEVLNFNMQDPLLGLDTESYHKLAENVTMVVQNAWNMDFIIPVEEFEKDCIRSALLTPRSLRE